MTQSSETPAANEIAYVADRPLPFLKIDFSERGTPLAPGATVQVLQGDLEVEMTLPGVREQLTGDAAAPDFTGQLEERFALLFSSIEGSFADYCQTTGRRERDREVQRLYRRLREYPDGEDRNPLFGHLRGALRLFLWCNPLSPAEYDAVLGRLVDSVRHWAKGKDSCNYLDQVNETLERLMASQEAADAEGEAAPEGAETSPQEE